MNLKWERNYKREEMRDREGPAFEWWSAEWFVIRCHVHNNTDGGRWAMIINGAKSHQYTQTFSTKELAFSRIEAIIEYACKKFLTPSTE